MKNKTSKKQNKKIDVRRYVNFTLLMISVVLVAFIASKLYKTYRDNSLSESVFSRMGSTIQSDDIDSIVSEMATDGFILISYTKNEDIKKMESKLKKSIVNNELQSNFYYLDATDLMLEEGYLDTLNEKLGLDDATKIQKLPAILYYFEGEHMKTLTSTDDRMINVDDFNKLLDSYEIIERD